MNVWVATLLALTSAGLFWLGYFVAWPLMLVCAVPLCMVFCGSSSRRGAVFWSLVGGFMIWRPLEDSLAIYGQSGVTLLCLWQAFTLVPVGLLVQMGCRKGWAMTCLVPLAWVGGESLRMWGPLGFPFGALSIPAFEQVWLIQVADLGGLPLVSFLFGAANGFVLDWCIRRRVAFFGHPCQRRCLKRLPWRWRACGCLPWLTVNFDYNK